MSVFVWPHLRPCLRPRLRLYPCPVNDDAGPPPWPAYFSPAANNNDAARHPSLPCYRRLAAPSNRTRPARHNRPDTASQTQPGQPQPSRPHPVTQPAASIQSPNWLHPLSHDI